MIKHQFHINRDGYPAFKIEDQYFMLQDLSTLRVEEIKKFIKDLQSVINEEIDRVDIEGYDTTILECSKTGCLTYYGAGEIMIPVGWILNLFIDWLEFLKNHGFVNEE